MGKVIVFSGSFNRPSKTTALVNYIGKEVAKKFGTEVVTYDLLDVGNTLGLAQRADKLEPKGQQIIEELTLADALVIGSPVYKGSYPGLFKHFIDLIEPERLYVKPVLLSATGAGGPDNEIRSQDIITRIEKAVNQFTPFIKKQPADSASQKTTIQLARENNDVLPLAANS